MDISVSKKTLYSWGFTVVMALLMLLTYSILRAVNPYSLLWNIVKVGVIAWFLINSYLLRMSGLMYKQTESIHEESFWRLLGYATVCFFGSIFPIGLALCLSKTQRRTIVVNILKSAMDKDPEEFALIINRAENEFANGIVTVTDEEKVAAAEEPTPVAEEIVATPELPNAGNAQDIVVEVEQTPAIKEVGQVARFRQLNAPAATVPVHVTERKVKERHAGKGKEIEITRRKSVQRRK